MPSSNRPFRVIVVGGGVAGLTASHCLQKAGIDHVVLEKRDVVAPPEGASIAIYPHGSRILHQIGCWEPVRKACVPCNRWLVRAPDGRKMLDNGYFGYLEENHGSGLLLLERREFLQILYDGLPDKSPIRTSCGVKDIKHIPGGVEVTLSNGKVETGDMVLGCDGVYSLTRSFMWDHANKTTPDLITVKEKRTMRTRWKSLIGIAPGIPELGERDLNVVSNKGHSFLALSQPDRVYFFLIFRVDKPFTWPKRAGYTDQDAEESAQQFADHAVSGSMVFGELWKRRIRGSLVPLEEGVLDHWYHGRIVLAGDAVHKITPNIALGGNSAMESVVVLCNHLHALLHPRNPPNPNPNPNASIPKPDDAALNTLFSSYQSARRARMQQILQLSSLVTRIQAWDTPWHRFLGSWVLPFLPDRATADQIGEIIRAAPKLEFVDTKGFPGGRMEWDEHKGNEGGMRVDMKGKERNRGGGGLWGKGSLVGAVAALLVIWGVAQGVAQGIVWRLLFLAGL